MNADVQHALVAAANMAVVALREDATDNERQLARLALHQALKDLEISVAAAKQTDPDFDGQTYDPEYDKDRLTNQLGRIYSLMRDHAWRTLDEIHKKTGDPAASVSAQLRHLRKPRFGSYRVERRHRGDPANGLFEYRVLPPDGRVEHVVADIQDIKGVPQEFRQGDLLSK